jgi:hypothetical protein
VGPGDKLSVVAPGYKTASVAINADRRVHMRLVAQEDTRILQVNQWLRAGRLGPVWRYVFLAPKGYGYEDVPPQVKAEARRGFAAAAGEVKGFEARSVTKGGAAANMTVLVLALDPRVAALPGATENFLTGVSQGAGARPRPITLAGGDQAAYPRPSGRAQVDLLQRGIASGCDRRECRGGAQEVRGRVHRRARVTHVRAALPVGSGPDRAAEAMRRGSRRGSPPPCVAREA